MTVETIEGLISSLKEAINEQEMALIKYRKWCFKLQQDFSSKSLQYDSVYADYTNDSNNRDKYDIYARLYQDLVSVKSNYEDVKSRYERTKKIIKVNKRNLSRYESMLNEAKTQEED